jgi:ABC-type phosphate transport system substrate-binding protein
MAVYFTQSPATVTANFSDQLHLELGEPAEIDPTSYLAHVGYEEIVLIANQLNPLDELTLEELQGIYVGKESRWNQGSDQPIQVWVLPVGDTARQVFDSAVIPSQSISPNALLAPDAGAMLEAVAGDEYAIGYLPASFITSSDPSLSVRIKLIKIDNLPAERFTLPVITVTDEEPEGLTRQLIICLQEATP